jgi:cell division protein FtsN
MTSKKFDPYFVLVLLFLGCAGSQSQMAAPPMGGSSAIREEFDPYTLNDDDFLLQPAARAEVAPPQAAPLLTEATRKTAGFRVQIAAVLDRTRAESLRERIQREVQALTYIYYDEDTHLYKIQAGNSRTPEQAERLRDNIKAQGFPEAYVVRTQIEVTDVQPQVRRPVTTSGYRVQIFSSSTRHAAEESQTQASAQLNRDDVFIDFEPPYFKVRIGNFQARKDAEKFLDEAKKKGYETPFIVQAQIRTSPR